MKREGSVTKVALKNNKGVAYEYWQCRYYDNTGKQKIHTTKLNSSNSAYTSAHHQSYKSKKFVKKRCLFHIIIV